MNAIAEENPTYKFFDEDVYPEALNYHARSARVSLDMITTLSVFQLEILQSIDESTWSRVSIAEDGSKVSIQDLFDKVVSHRKAHLEQLKKTIG